MTGRARPVRRSSARSRASEHDERERLGEVVVGAGVERLGLVVLAVLGREHQDRCPVAGVAQLLAHLVAVHARQHDVEHDHVVRVLGRHPEAVGAGERDVDAKPSASSPRRTAAATFFSSSTMSTRMPAPASRRRLNVLEPEAEANGTCRRPWRPVQLARFSFGLRTVPPMLILAAGTLTYLQAIVIGILQGITELFPISSLGHSVLVPELLGWHSLVAGQSADESFYLAFLVGLHVATAIALLIFFRHDWVAVIRGFFTLDPRSGGSTPRAERMAWLLVLGTIPVGIVGLVFEHSLRTVFAKPTAAAIFLTINGADPPRR